MDIADTSTNAPTKRRRRSVSLITKGAGEQALKGKGERRPGESLPMGNCRLNAITVGDDAPTVDSEQSHTPPEKGGVSPEEAMDGSKGERSRAAVSAPVTFSSQTDIEREISQEKLRELVMSDPIDWDKVIRLAEELHKKERACLKSKRVRHRALISARWYSAFFGGRRRRRRRMDSVGSFSVNIISHEREEYKYRGDVESPMSNTTADDSVDELDELETYEDDNHGYSRPPAQQQRPSTPPPFDVVIGGFMAATSLYKLPDEEESDSSSSSSNDDDCVTLNGITRKLVFDDNNTGGLVTIEEEGSEDDEEEQGSGEEEDDDDDITCGEDQQLTDE